uniref:Uncharacterized protein n=1 Tax=Manihot esculenta TaxID=3983 RepID=A0A2C9W0P1_MANES
MFNGYDCPLVINMITNVITNDYMPPSVEKVFLTSITIFVRITNGLEPIGNFC